MELVELALSNFKRFADAKLGFCPGLNLLWGPNESGKSTIHEAICCALFGRERGKVLENWNGGFCSVILTYRSGDLVYRIERRLTEGVSRLGALAGDDLTDVASRNDEIERILADHLGITSRQVFDNTLSIKQKDMSRPDVSDMEAVGGEIQRVLTGTAHVSAAEALKRLEAGRNTVKGKARPSNPREFDKITERLGRLAEELADARRSRTQIRNLEEELSDLQGRIERDSGRLSALAELLQRHKRWSELKKSEGEIDNLHQSVFATLRKLQDTLADLKFAQKELEGYADLVEKDEQIAEHLRKIGSRRGELDARLTELESAGEESGSAVRRLAPTVLPAATLALALAGLGLGFLADPRAFLLLLPAFVLAIKCVQMRAAAPVAEFRHVTEMIGSAHSELKQLDAEEASILSYIHCRDADRAWAKIKRYRSLTDRIRELEIALNALLGGRKMEDWEAQEAQLARELSTVRRELEEDFPGYSPTAKETEAWRSEHAALQNSLPRAEARLHEVRGSLEAEKRNARDLAALEGEIEFLHGRKTELEFLYKAYGEAITALNTVTQAVSDEYLPELSERASGHLERITSGRYTSVCVKPDWEVSVDCRDKSAIQPSMLSIGTLDQMYFALRMACGGLLSDNRKLPVVLDDPFVAFDRPRLENVLDLLRVLAEENQILLLTHDPYVLDWARNLSSDGTPVQIHELPGPG
ncbi:MAG TPA: AAA family ATPase [Armatimonadota bacterium]|nr:AAA family ATPase [Armatimonadota bacterium]